MHDRTSDRSRRWLRTLLTVVITALVIAPAAALASHSFNDVDDSDFYHAAVDWMKDNGVTVGCNPPNNTRYCPEQSVTRGEMAVFLERLDTKDVFLRPDEDSVDGGDADTLDGLEGSDYAVDAEIDPFLPIALFTVTNGQMTSVDFRDPVTATPTISGADGDYLVDVPGFSHNILEDRVLCTATFSGDRTISVTSLSGDLRIVVYETDGTLKDGGGENDFSCAVYDG